MRVFCHIPVDWTEDGSVVVVMHGMERNAASYVHACIRAVGNTSSSLAIICPEFSIHEFPTRREYNWGNVLSQQGIELPVEEWSLTTIENIYDAFCGVVGRSPALGYYLYGHSAGAQFVHRFVALVTRSRVIRAFACNAGVWTFPTLGWRYPFGMLGLSDGHIRAFLKAPLVVLLGENDTDPAHKHLDTAPPAMLQGSNRLQRGLAFFSTGRAVARHMGIPFGWAIRIVPGVAHTHYDMFRAVLGMYILPEIKGKRD
jgi:hypothetical protein